MKNKDSRRTKRSKTWYWRGNRWDDQRGRMGIPESHPNDEVASQRGKGELFRAWCLGISSLCEDLAPALYRPPSKWGASAQHPLHLLAHVYHLNIRLPIRQSLVWVLQRVLSLLHAFVVFSRVWCGWALVGGKLSCMEEAQLKAAHCKWKTGSWNPHPASSRHVMRLLPRPGKLLVHPASPPARWAAQEERLPPKFQRISIDSETQNKVLLCPFKIKTS